MKFDSSDIIALLRLFNVVRDDIQLRQIEKIQKSKPYEKNVLIRFTFQKDKYAILIDSGAEDDEAYILEQVIDTESGDLYTIQKNPNADDFLTYAMPYRGKECYLLVSKRVEKRLDVVLVERFGAESRSTYQKMIQRGLVTVNNEIVTTPKKIVLPNDVIEVMAQNNTAEKLQYDCLYEDENVLVIDKPAGMLTHAKGAISEEFTASDIVRELTSYKQDTNRPGIVHRLDRDTSGVLLMVKNTETASYIQKQFSERTVKKIYTAIVEGKPVQSEAIIDIPIERNPSIPSTFRTGSRGKSAQTYYKVEMNGSLYSLVELRPKTGRTHQLRVHMKHIGCPIVGDRVYGNTAADRMFLHAHTLELTLPGGVRKVFEAKIPASFTEFMAR